MHNTELGELNNANFLVNNVLMDAGLPGKVWFVYANEFPSFLSIVWRHGKEAVLVAVVLLVLFLWNRGQRFTAILPPEQPIRRSLLEHIEAAGRFAWYREDRATLGQSARELALHGIYARQSRSDHTLTDTVVTRIATQTGMTERAVRKTLGNPPVSGPIEFTQWIRSIQKIWKLQ